MAMKTHEVTVGEKVYEITTFPAIKGLRHLKSLLKIVGPSIAELMSEQSNLTTDVSNNTLTIAVKALVDNFDEGVGVEKLIADFMSTVTVNGQPFSFDVEFAENYGTLIKLVTEVIRLNYSSVFQQGAFGEMFNNQ